MQTRIEANSLRVKRKYHYESYLRFSVLWIFVVIKADFKRANIFTTNYIFIYKLFTMWGLSSMDLFILLLMWKLSRKAFFGYILSPQTFLHRLRSFDVRSIKNNSSLSYSTIRNLNRIWRVILQGLAAPCISTVIKWLEQSFNMQNTLPERAETEYHLCLWFMNNDAGFVNLKDFCLYLCATSLLLSSQFLYELVFFLQLNFIPSNAKRFDGRVTSPAPNLARICCFHCHIVSDWVICCFS